MAATSPDGGGSERSSRPVAVVGTGAIGTPMALRLEAAGHVVTAVDPMPSAQLVGRGGFRLVASFDAIDARGRPEVVVVTVATPEQLRVVVDVAVRSGVADQTWVVMSTVGTEAVRAEGARLVRAGAHVLDVPVTGGVARAVTGGLTLFAAGEDGDREAVRDVLEVLGTVVAVGPALGDGQAVKLVNQHLCSVHLAAAAEAMALARQLGLEPSSVLPLVAAGAASSFMLSDRGPRMLAGTDVEVTSSIGIFVKDSGLVADAAGAAEADVPLLEAARSRFLAAAAAGLEYRDDSRVIETYRGE